MRCLKIIVFKYLAQEKGMGRVYIFDFIVNVANDMWNLGFKGLLHILMNPIFVNFFKTISHSIFLQHNQCLILRINNCS